LLPTPKNLPPQAVSIVLNKPVPVEAETFDFFDVPRHRLCLQHPGLTCSQACGLRSAGLLTALKEMQIAMPL
jgi:hypothetical protein